MAGNKKPRKAYRPKPILANPMGWLMDGMRTLPDYEGGGELRKLLLKAYASHAAITEGAGTQQHAHIIKGMLEVTETILHLFKIGQEFSSVVTIGRAAYTMLEQRAKRTGRWVYSGAELNAVRDLLELHDEQLKLLTVDKLCQAINYLRKLNGRNPPWLEQQLQAEAVAA